MVFPKKKSSTGPLNITPSERVSSVIGPGISWKGDLHGKGGIRIEGIFEGEIAVRGLIVIGETGRIACQTLVADSVVVAGALKGNIRATKLEIRSTGRVWGDVVTTSFSTEEGAYLRGQITMEETLTLDFGETASETPMDAQSSSSEENLEP